MQPNWDLKPKQQYQQSTDTTLAEKLVGARQAVVQNPVLSLQDRTAFYLKVSQSE
jgi:hypothetical protein